MNPEHLETDPVEVLDPHGFEGEPWAEALDAGDPDRARSAFVEGLRTGPRRADLDANLIALRRRWSGAAPGEHAGFDLDPDSIADGRYVGVYGVEHRFEDGVDWFHNPTAADEHDFTREWQWTFNRHYQWIALADAYDETGDPAYAEAFEDELRSWIEQCPRPDDAGLEHPSAWRTIETGIRAGQVWPYAFETFRRADAVSDGALWLMICSLRDQGVHLLEHVTTHNWKTMESNGLAHVGAMVPELDGARTFLWTGVDRTVAELERQFYPDGLQHELAPEYGAIGSLGNLYSALALADERGALVVPDRAWERLADVNEAYARLAGPDGRCPPLHDSRSLDAAAVYAEFDGEGAPPEGGRSGGPSWESGESDHLRWGGYGILRRDDRYAMLDAGPYGAGHQHQDTLQVLGYAGGEWVLVDPGTPQYTDSPVTDHLRSAAAHNVVLLDGERHEVRPEVRIADEPHPVSHVTSATVDATAAARSFETIDAGATFDHERVLCDVAGVGWLVVDRLTPRDDGSHAFEWLWQSPGAVTISGDGATVDVGDEAGPSLRIEPSGSRPTTTTVASARRDPYRGWKPVREAADHDPLPTVRVESAEATGEMTMVTLLSPTSASLRDATFEGTERTATIASGNGDATVSLIDGDAGQVRTIRFRGPDSSETLSLSEHALLAE